MIVKCKAKWGKDLPEKCQQPEDGFGIDHEFSLILGNYYIVYGITLWRGYIWYYLCDESYSYYPFWNPSPLFEVANKNLSKYWVYNLRVSDKDNHLNITFPEWANDCYYYDRLTDGYFKDIEVFKKYKYLMDLEFPDPSVTVFATELDAPWLLCPICIDAWESNSQDGMVICPMCKNKLHNPRYKKPPETFISGLIIPE